MYDDFDFELECGSDECGIGPPPTFNIPPPPRPDFLQQETCSDNSLSDFDMCEAIPVSYSH